MEQVRGHSGPSAIRGQAGDEAGDQLRVAESTAGPPKRIRRQCRGVATGRGSLPVRSVLLPLTDARQEACGRMRGDDSESEESEMTKSGAHLGGQPTRVGCSECSSRQTRYEAGTSDAI